MSIQNFQRWLKDSGKSPHTVRAYVKDTRRFVEFINKPLDRVIPIDFSSFYQHLRDQYGYSERSLNRVGWSVSKFLQSQGRSDLARLVPKPDFTPEIEEIKWLDKPIIFEMLDNSKTFRKAVLGTSYDLALRVGEVNLIRREWFDPKKGEMRVYRLKRKGVAPRMLLPVSDWCVRAIKSYLRRRKDTDLLLFPHSTATFQNHYRRALMGVGINPDDYSFHTLRHSRLTHMAIDMIENEGQADLVRLAQFAGHRRQSTTLLYVHLATEYLRGR